MYFPCLVATSLGDVGEFPDDAKVVAVSMGDEPKKPKRSALKGSRAACDDPDTRNIVQKFCLDLDVVVEDVVDDCWNFGKQLDRGTEPPPPRRMVDDPLSLLRRQLSVRELAHARLKAIELAEGRGLLMDMEDAEE